MRKEKFISLHASCLSGERLNGVGSNAGQEMKVLEHLGTLRHKYDSLGGSAGAE